MGSEESKLSSDDLDELKLCTKFTGQQLQDWYHKFTFDFPDGFIAEPEFLQMYTQMFPKGDAKKFAKHVFRSYDTDGNGRISFKEFMTTLSVATQGSSTEKLHWAFKMYDQNNDGVVTMDEVTEIVTAIHRMKGTYNRNKINMEAKNLFSKMDKDNNGEITEEEFISGAKECPSVMALLQDK